MMDTTIGSKRVVSQQLSPEIPCVMGNTNTLFLPRQGDHVSMGQNGNIFFGRICCTCESVHRKLGTYPSLGPEENLQHRREEVESLSA